MPFLPFLLNRLRRRLASLVLVLAALGVCLDFVWDGLETRRQNLEFQTRHMQATATAAARQITLRIEDLRIALRLFADANSKQLHALRERPNDEAAFNILSSRLQAHYPDYYGLTLTDARGLILYDDFGEKVGPLCRQDLKQFTSTWHGQQPYIHPGPGHYHFDVMVPWGETAPEGALFASFEPTMLVDILRWSRQADYQLVMTRADTPDLIEVTDAGSRDKLGDHYRLDQKASGSDRITVPVAGTAWLLHALPDLEQRRAASLEQWREIGIRMAAVLVVSVLSLFVLERAQTRRNHAEQALRQAHDELEVRVQERTRDLIQSESVSRKLSTAMQQTHDAVVITNRSGRIDYVNPAFEAITGFTREETLGQTMGLIKSDHHPPEFYRQLWDQILAGKTYRDTLINRRKDGQLYYEEKTITPIRDETGAITHFVSTGKDITERIQSEQRLNYLAHHDALTGLPNRTMFYARLDHAISQARRSGKLIALMFIDLDGFKAVNDSLGHKAGDQLLKILGERLRACVRESDTVSRLGGDEFTVILEGLEQPDHVSVTAMTLLDRLSEPVHLEDQVVAVSGSIGIAFYPLDASTRETLIQLADAAMYRAKSSAGGAVAFHSPPPAGGPA